MTTYHYSDERERDGRNILKAVGRRGSVCVSCFCMNEKGEKGRKEKEIFYKNVK